MYQELKTVWMILWVWYIHSFYEGGEQPIPLWNEHDTSTDADKPKILLYSLSLMFKVPYVKFLKVLISKVSHLCFFLLVEFVYHVLMRYLTAVFLKPGDPDDSHHSVNASCALWNGPDWAGAFQQDSVQDAAWRQQQLFETVWQMSGWSQLGSWADC